MFGDVRRAPAVTSYQNSRPRISQDSSLNSGEKGMPSIFSPLNSPDFVLNFAHLMPLLGDIVNIKDINELWSLNKI